MSTTPALDALVTELERAFAAGSPDGAAIAGLLREYAAREEDWRLFAFFSDEGYTRNLVHRAEEFELLILCWGPGQESPIHNHEGQDCWMGVLEGQIEELRYPTPDEVGTGPPEERGRASFGQGEVAFIRDDIGLHLVRSGQTDQPGVSLHLYAAPYDECSCYCPETGKITRKRFSNHSVRGRLLSSAGS